MAGARYEGGPAFPRDSLSHSPGMSLRDWFAGNAPPMPTEWLAAFVRDNPIYQHESKAADGWLAANVAWSAAYADAMLAERRRDD